MILPVKGVLTREQVLEWRQRLEGARWEEGQETAGSQARQVKRNRQLPMTSPLGQELGDRVLEALARQPDFLSAALPLKIFPPQFNRYGVGETYGLHVDNAIRVVPGTITRVRTDLSCTLFLCDPTDYEGGELLIEDRYGSHAVKLEAGDLLLYPSTSLHTVTPVTAGERVCAFFWIQSMVRDDGRRELLFDLDLSIRALTPQMGANHPEVLRLSGIYQNLIRQWADA